MGEVGEAAVQNARERDQEWLLVRYGEMCQQVHAARIERNELREKLANEGAFYEQKLVDVIKRWCSSIGWLYVGDGYTSNSDGLVARLETATREFKEASTPMLRVVERLEDVAEEIEGAVSKEDSGVRLQTERLRELAAREQPD